MDKKGYLSIIILTLSIASCQQFHNPREVPSYIPEGNATAHPQETPFLDPTPTSTETPAPTPTETQTPGPYYSGSGVIEGWNVYGADLLPGDGALNTPCSG